MPELSTIEKRLSYFGSELAKKILEVSAIKDIPKNTEIIREGEYIKVIPILASGLVKVFTRSEEKELLLYYIQPFESCIMSFSAGLNNEKSRIFAVTEEDSSLILIPTEKVNQWIGEYPQLNRLFYQQYDLRYTELLDTINHLVFDKLEKRIYDHLNERVKLTGKNPVKISHKELAGELGTAREVVSRLVKKLEREGRVKQNSDSISIF
ncbi:MAG: Crp/Fnr family transcriptional regulator [Bacteroidia bacterium]|nr:Crp/Fnr family transcriptional regulator [Bacteroidia bacterium]